MTLRLGCLAFVACSLVNAAPGPWDRFFNKPALSAKQGIDTAFDHAVASAFNPLSMTAPDQPTFPQLDNQTMPVVLAQTPVCAVPLREIRVSPEFSMSSSKAANSAIDGKMLKATPIPACK